MQFDPAIDALTLIRRARAATGYDERLDGLAEGIERAVREARALTAATAPAARPLLHAVIEGPAPAPCHPMCCQASYVRATVLRGRRTILEIWGQADPDAARGFTPDTFASLFGPQSRAIAIAAAQMFCRAPDAARVHVDRLAEIALGHPRWQVRLAVAQAIRAASRAGAPRVIIEAVAEGLMASDRQALQAMGARLSPPRV